MSSLFSLYIFTICNKFSLLGIVTISKIILEIQILGFLTTCVLVEMDYKYQHPSLEILVQAQRMVLWAYIGFRKWAGWLVRWASTNYRCHEFVFRREGGHFYIMRTIASQITVGLRLHFSLSTFENPNFSSNLDNLKPKCILFIYLYLSEGVFLPLFSIYTEENLEMFDFLISHHPLAKVSPHHFGHLLDNFIPLFDC